MAFTLITVSYGGEIRHSSGFATKAMCEIAKSIALTGMTPEENKAADEAYAEWKNARAKEWRDAHPPRYPRTKEERALKFGEGTFASSSPYSTKGEDGLIYDWPGSGFGMSMSYNPNAGESAEYVRGVYVLKHAGDTKAAFCISEEDAE